jgi:hypothetical protein
VALVQRTFLFAAVFFGVVLAFIPALRGVDFSRDVEPLLARHCVQCHGPEKQKSGYRLDQAEDARRGGDSGKPAIVVGDSAASALVQRITAEDPDIAMPPKGDRLSSNEIAILREWIDQGAVWPARESPPSNVASSSRHWSFKPVKRPSIPPVRRQNRTRNPIDNFVFQRLEREKLVPSPEADRTVLIRRLYLDLIGLLPAPAEVEAFVSDERPDACERLVDALLASPHFGERWGRHWLDLARYADSAGYQIDRVRPGAYLYRDWVVDSFNRDQPFDQFTVEQLAGDLLPEPTPEQRLATGFHRMTLSNLEDGVDKVEFDCKAKVDRVATTGTAWLGLTIGCAECHTHKYDPITQREFYQLYAFFNDAEEFDQALPNERARAQHAARLKAWELEKAQLTEARSRYIEKDLPLKQLQWEERARGTTNQVSTILAVPREKRSAVQRKEMARFYRGIDSELQQFAARLKAHQRRVPKLQEEQVLQLRGLSNPPPTFVHVRGDFLNRGEEVQPGLLRVLNQIPERDSNQRRLDRLDLARWIVAPENPLTARVAVNHIWLHLFGRGLVNTPEDFGTRGEPPSHPELLDWLASEFQARGWSRKQLIRLIVTSATYRQSSHVRRDLLRRDPQNVLLARQNRVRVESEIVRDLYLDASGLLRREIGGPGIYPPIPADVKAAGYGVGGQWIETEAPEKYRRGLYVISRRTVPYPVSMTFDQANPNECVARRESSNTPLQPLALLNNPVFAECSAAFADRLASLDGDVDEKIETGFRVCLARKPSRAEQRRLEALFHTERSRARGSEASAWRAVAEVLLNLDEFLTRE